jgi:hypothetical protein
MRITFLFLSLAIAFGISLPLSQLKANDVGRPDVVSEVAAEPALAEDNQAEKVVEDDQELLGREETIELADVNEECLPSESETSESEAATNDQATELVPVSEPVSTIMIEVFEATEDSLSTESGDAVITEVAECDGGVENTTVDVVTLEVEESAIAESSEAASEVATTDTVTPDEAVAEATAVAEEISEEIVAQDADEVSAEATPAPVCNEVESIADEAITFEAEEAASEATASNDVGATLADDSAIDQVAESAEITALVEATSEEVVANDADEVCVEGTSAPVCSENEGNAGEATDELVEVVADEVICDAVEGTISGEEPVLAEANASEVVEEVVSTEANEWMNGEVFDAWTDAWVAYWAGEANDELGNISDVPCNNEADSEVSSVESVEVDSNEITEECYALEDGNVEEAIEVMDADTTVEVADEVIEAAEVEEPATESTPTETQDSTEPTTVRTIQLDGCTVTIQSAEHLDDSQLLNALWNAVNQLEIEMD